MDAKELTERLKQSNVAMNPVLEFVPVILEQYLCKNMDSMQFCTEWIRKMNRAKFYLALMSKELRRESQTVFAKELGFADRINLIVLQAQRSEIQEAQLRTGIEEALSGYLNETA